MRLNLKLIPNNQVNIHMEIPLDFRRHFISFIKMILDGTEIFQRFELEQPGFSPYVFGVNFNRIVDIDRERGIMKIKPPVYMEISSGIPEVTVALANGALKLRGNYTVLGLRLSSVNVPPLKTIKRDSVLFKIKKHAVLRGKNDYLDPGYSKAEEIEESLNTHLSRQIDFIYKNYHTKYSFSPITYLADESSLRKGVCEHYGGKLTTVCGTIALKGRPEMLNFIYNFGLGVRTGQGFGLVNTV